MSDDRSIINLSLRLIFVFNFLYNERDDFEFKKNSSLKLKSKSFKKRSQHENVKNNLIFMNVYADII